MATKTKSIVEIPTLSPVAKDSDPSPAVLFVRVGEGAEVTGGATGGATEDSAQQVAASALAVHGSLAQSVVAEVIQTADFQVRSVFIPVQEVSSVISDPLILSSLLVKKH